MLIRLEGEELRGFEGMSDFRVIIAGFSL